MAFFAGTERIMLLDFELYCKIQASDGSDPITERRRGGLTPVPRRAAQLVDGV